jgi:hypothetical protein
VRDQNVEVAVGTFDVALVVVPTTAVLYVRSGRDENCERMKCCGSSSVMGTYL